MVAMLATVDGVSITNSEFFRESFYSRGITLPKSEHLIKKIICQKYEYVEENKILWLLMSGQVKKPDDIWTCASAGQNDDMPGKCGALEIRDAWTTNYKSLE